MPEPAQRENVPPDPTAAPTPPGVVPAAPSPDAEAAASSLLSPEVQMARFEAALKESDWGHQPC